MLDGDDETNGMCPIIGPGRDVHIVGLSAPNTPKHSMLPVPPPGPWPSLFPSPLSLFRPEAPFAYSSVCACICLFVRSYLICRLPARVFMNLRSIYSDAGRAEIGEHKIFI